MNIRTLAICALVAGNIALSIALLYSYRQKTLTADHVETIHADIERRVFNVTVGDSSGSTQVVTLTPRAALQLQSELGRMFELMKRGADALQNN